MLDVVLKALRESGADGYIVRSLETEATELYLIRHDEDMLRRRLTRSYTVTLYKDYSRGDVRMRGHASVKLFPNDSASSVRARLDSALATALSVSNPYYELTSAAACAALPHVSYENDAALLRKAAASLISSESGSQSRMAAAELFSEHENTRILTSVGTDVSFVKDSFRGELVARCTKSRDVELFREFAYATVDECALARFSRELLASAEARASAGTLTESGKYSVIFTGHAIAELFRMYVAKSRAESIASHCSSYSIGDDVQRAEYGERLNLALVPSAAYSPEGIPMAERTLIADGVLTAIHGDTRACRMLGVEPAGTYTAIRCDNGSADYETMQLSPHIRPIAFSDFIMDSVSGNFAGEIRLAYVFDGRDGRYITGGAVSGNLEEAGRGMVFSKERYEEQNYSGPLALMLGNVTVSC